MAHACNPSYSGGREQEDYVWGQPVQIVQETLSQNTQYTKGLMEWLKW
jgi:hypothetical protein